MIVNFLAAADGTPLTKTFTSSFGQVTKSAYPNVRDFISHSVEVTNTTELFAAISVHAEQHHCMLKGIASRELNGESRQGLTDANSPTQWICFDADHIPGVNTVDDLIALLPQEFQNTSYVTQYSCSSGITSNDLRVHVFFLLATPIIAPLLKLWMKNLNLNAEALKQNIKLAEGGCTLKWPLDIGVNQNDKLIYIAPPICRDVVDPIPANERIRLHVGANDKVTLNVADLNAEQIRTAELAVVNGLRKAMNLPAKKLKTAMLDGLVVLQNADEMTLVGQPFEERGFVYLPIGSNPYTYYHPVGNHEFLRTFKDPEMAFPMRTVLPSYYWQMERASAPEASTGTIVVTFRDRNTDTKYVGCYSENLKFATFNAIRAREDIEDFFSQHRQRMPEAIPTWDYEFNPTRLERINPQLGWANKFAPTPFMEMTGSGRTEIPPRTAKLLNHVMNNDAECVNHFLNWLAFKFQTRTKCKTAWFFQGIEGTGKGVLYNKILNPLFGDAHCRLKRMDNLLDNFNADLETSLLWVIDEANIEDFNESGQIIEKLKNLITEDRQMIRAMRTNAYSVLNYTDVIMFSNRNLAIKLSESDRRYNVAPRQNSQLLRVMTPEEIDTLEEELPAFADYLLSREVNKQQAHTPLDNAARRKLVEISRSPYDAFIHNLLLGDLTYFLRGTTETEGPNAIRMRQTAIDIMKSWCHDALNNRTSEVAVDDLSRVYAFVISGKEPATAAKFARILSLRGCQLTEHALRQPTIDIRWEGNHLDFQRWLNDQSLLSSRSPHGQQGSLPSH